MPYILLAKPPRPSRKEENMSTKSARSKFSTLKQICDHIPGHLGLRHVSRFFCSVLFSRRCGV